MPRTNTIEASFLFLAIYITCRVHSESRIMQNQIQAIRNDTMIGATHRSKDILFLDFKQRQSTKISHKVMSRVMGFNHFDAYTWRALALFYDPLIQASLKPLNLCPRTCKSFEVN